MKITAVCAAVVLALFMLDETVSAATVNMKVGINLTEGPPGGNVNDAGLLSDLGHMKCLRFMDWQSINDWPGRQASDEECIRFCNAVNADAWMCIKHTMSDDEIRSMARTVRDNLETGLKCYVEFSNETWNSANPYYIQMYYCYDLAVNNGLIPPNYNPAIEDHHRFVAAWGHVYRVAQAWRIFEEEFGSSFPTRVRKVLGSCVEAMYTGNMLVAMEDSRVNPHGYLADVVAIAPYFGHEAAYSNAASAFSAAQGMGVVAAPHKRAVAGYNTKNGAHAILAGYEGGQHYASGQDLFSRSSGAYDAYKAYLDAVGPYMDLMCMYTYTHWSYSSEHSWGCKESTGQSNSQAHKFRAIIDWAGDHPYTETPVGTAPRRSAVAVTAAVAPAGLAVFDLQGRRVVAAKGTGCAQGVVCAADRAALRGVLRLPGDTE